MTKKQALQIRNRFAGKATAMIILSARAVDQALDPTLPDLKPEDVIHYCNELRKIAGLIETSTLFTPTAITKKKGKRKRKKHV